MQEFPEISLHLLVNFHFSVVTMAMLLFSQKRN